MNNGFLNNSSSNKFLNRIKENLSRCKSFDFSVSFIKKAGLDLMISDIRNALKRGANGRIITSTYQNFTDILSLQEFLNLQKDYPRRFECHLDYECFGENGFHTKGYIFSFDDRSEIIIGSSNITFFALLKNEEWDLLAETGKDDDLVKTVGDEFERLWNTTLPLSADLIKKYQTKLYYAVNAWDMDNVDFDINKSLIKPNIMQRQALKQLDQIRKIGANKALIVSATGSGKTYLAAFDLLNFSKTHQFKKFLYVVHREQILQDAAKTFFKVFGGKYKIGFYTGNETDSEYDFLFASSVMLKRHLDLFNSDEFDYIVIDEVHHAGAQTYTEIINYFHPCFMLGLTATPDRMDGKDVYGMFGNNVPYDLRLREAIGNDLVVPFRYYGIKDSLVSYQDTATKSAVLRYIAEETSDEHCCFIDEKIKEHLPQGKLKCVGFCRDKEHAKAMAEKMRLYGYETDYITGDVRVADRATILNRLQDDNNPLNIVFAVDVLNEGIDVPSLNMVLFLRPTDSSTIFIQQLGRGLRKSEGKEYLTVLDFIGNSYKRSIQIAIALSSLSKSGFTDKVTLRNYMKTEYSALDLSGVQIHFDRESMDEILESINTINLDNLKFAKNDYQNFKNYLKLNVDEYPKHLDFLNDEIAIDMMRFVRKFDKNKYCSYYEFLNLVPQAGIPKFNDEQRKVISTLTWFLPLARAEEFIIIKTLLDGPKTKDELMTEYKKIMNVNELSFNHALLMLMGNVHCNVPRYFKSKFPVKFDGEKYSVTFDTSNHEFLDWINDLLDYGILRYENEFGLDFKGGPKKFMKYSKQKVFMVLNSRSISKMPGINTVDGKLVLHINLNKSLEKNERLKYKDRFLDAQTLQWESQNGTTMTNKKGKELLKYKKALIFVSKKKEDDSIYLGVGSLTNPHDATPGETDLKKKKLVFDIVLEEKVPDVYKYDFGIEDAEDE